MTADLALGAAFKTVPAHWSSRRFRNVVERREDRRGTRSIPLLSLASAGHLYARTEASDRQQASEEGTQRCLVVQPGDLVVNPMWLTGGSVAVSDLEGAVSPDYRVFRPREDVYPRFLHHLLRSAAYMDQYRLYTRADTTFDRRVQQQDLDDMPIRLPPLEEQRRIADFLDDQVARIDRLIVARRAQLALSGEVLASGANELLAPLGYTGPPLSAVARIIDTEHKTAPDAPGGGFWIAGTGSLRDGRIVIESLREIDAATFSEWTRRGRPRDGDVFLSREAPVGQVGLVEPRVPPVAVGQRVVLIRPGKGLDSGFLRLVLMSPTLGDLVVDAVQGSLHPHLNMADISRLRVPLRTVQEQIELGRRHRQLLESVDEWRRSLEKSVNLLQGLKESAMASALSGEFDVTSATGRGVAQ